MALKDVFRGKQTTTTAVAGNLTLIDAENGYVGFYPTCDIGDSFYGVLVLQNGQWESGEFTIISINPTIVSRPSTPIKSSNDDTSITMSAGTHTLVSCAINGELIPVGGLINCHGGRFSNSSLPGEDLVNRIPTNSVLDDITDNVHTIRPYYGNHYSIFMDDDKTLIVNNDDGEECGSMTITLVLTQDATGGRVITFPATWQEHGNNPIPTDPDSIVIIRAVSTGNESTGDANGINWRYWVEPGYYQPPQPFFTEITGAATIEIGDEGSVFLHPSSDTAAATWTVLTDLYNIGSSTRLMGQTGSGVITLEMSAGDTLTWSPSGGTGSRTLTAPFDATLTKITATDWMISGFGIS